MDGTIHTTPKGRRLTGQARESLLRHGFQEPFDTVDAIIEQATHVTTQADGAIVYIQRAGRRGRSYHKTQAAKESAEVVVQLILDRHLGHVVVQSVPTLITVHDLSRLVAYFEAHIARLQQHPDSESSVFVPLELGFQVHALAGEVQAGDDGEFSMRFFVNVGESSTAGHRVYIGGESVVTLKNLRVFLASLHEALAA